MTQERVLGVDACKAGWVGVALTDEALPAAHVGPDIETVLSWARESGSVAAVAIDIPIGLPDRSRRQADLLAKSACGPRQSSVFLTPVREALLAENHASAVAVNRRITGQGISVQAFALKRKLLEVEALTAHTDIPVIEVHPEVSFARLGGRPLATRKSTWAGMQQRRRLLDSAGIRLDDDFGNAGASAGVDDVLDAAVAAWTARRYVSGEARPMPDPPEVFSDGLLSAIWA